MNYHELFSSRLKHLKFPSRPQAEEKARLLVQMVNVPTPGKGETPKVASEDRLTSAVRGFLELHVC